MVEEGLVAAFVVLDGPRQLVPWKPTRVAQRLTEFGLEGLHLVVILALGEPFQRVKVVVLWMQVSCRDPDEVSKRAGRITFPIKRCHHAAPFRQLWRRRLPLAA